MQSFLAKQDRDLCILNNGPSVYGGPVVDAISKFNDLLSDPNPSSIRDRLFKTSHEFLEKPFAFYSSYLNLSRGNKEGVAA